MTNDYKQIAFKLQGDIEHLRWENAQRDLAFLSEMKQRAIKAFDNRDVSEHEMLIKMIDDWTHELNQVQ
jgi:hypothetical protein